MIAIYNTLFLIYSTISSIVKWIFFYDIPKKEIVILFIYLNALQIVVKNRMKNANLLLLLTALVYIILLKFFIILNFLMYTIVIDTDVTH